MKKSINNWFKKNTEEEEKVFRQGLLAFLVFIIVVILLKVFRVGIFLLVRGQKNESNKCKHNWTPYFSTLRG